eukprot:GHVO01011550.1.p1 GENE.GHVO01011550.1~~GHVO01011550.1.p1  ORF type:complete len:550 (+),score=141.92 GHVO01011550.1:52-1650(+)
MGDCRRIKTCVYRTIALLYRSVTHQRHMPPPPPLRRCSHTPPMPPPPAMVNLPRSYESRQSSEPLSSDAYRGTSSHDDSSSYEHGKSDHPWDIGTSDSRQATWDIEDTCPKSDHAWDSSPNDRTLPRFPTKAMSGEPAVDRGQYSMTFSHYIKRWKHLVGTMCDFGIDVDGLEKWVVQSGKDESNACIQDAIRNLIAIIQENSKYSSHDDAIKYEDMIEQQQLYIHKCEHEIEETRQVQKDHTKLVSERTILEQKLRVADVEKNKLKTDLSDERRLFVQTRSVLKSCKKEVASLKSALNRMVERDERIRKTTKASLDRFKKQQLNGMYGKPVRGSHLTDAVLTDIIGEYETKLQALEEDNAKLYADNSAMLWDTEAIKKRIDNMKTLEDKLGKSQTGQISRRAKSCVSIQTDGSHEALKPPPRSTAGEGRVDGVPKQRTSPQYVQRLEERIEEMNEKIYKLSGGSSDTKNLIRLDKKLFAMGVQPGRIEDLLGCVEGVCGSLGLDMTEAMNAPDVIERMKLDMTGMTGDATF